MSASERSDLVNLLYFFDHFTAPIFTAKGINQNVFFDIPESFYPEEYKHIAAEVKELAKEVVNEGGKRIIVKELKKELNLRLVKKLGRKERFTLFNPVHQKAAGAIIKILLEADVDDLISICAKLNLSGVNPYAFEYALSVALLHRKDTNFLPLPSPLAHTPEFYLNLEAMKTVTSEASNVRDSRNRNYIELKATATNKDPEHRVYYFREDIGINIHHWHWHVIYPTSAGGVTNERDIVDKDRRGELFYYMHSQILARYNTERLCNKLSRAKSFFYFREQIPEAYFSKLDTPYTTTNWAARHANARLSDIDRPGFNFRLLDLELYRDRILNSIHNGYVLKGDKLIKLEPGSGVDVLGNIVEASILSENSKYYGNLHNFGHIAFAYQHDPENKFLEDLGPMGDNRTAMRDPMFYRWHSMVDDIFNEYQKKLDPYTEDELNFKGIEIVSSKVTTFADRRLEIRHNLINQFITFMEEDSINLAYGLDVKYPGPVYLLFPHLQHKDFEYEIQIKNSNSCDKVGTVRIFIAPLKDETETDEFDFNEQRRVFIELDKFYVPLPAKKTVTVKQSSRNSSVTIPFRQMFLDIGDILKYLESNEKNYDAAADLAYCGCGWPHHMLIPRGTKAGYKCQLFVMVTDHDEDKVEGSDIDKPHQECKNCSKTGGGDEILSTAASFCGLKDKKYPDKKPMGYPFDRPPARNVHTLDDFVTEKLKNIAVTDVTVMYKEFKEMPLGESISKDMGFTPAPSAVREVMPGDAPGEVPGEAPGAFPSAVLLTPIRKICVNL